MLQLLQSGRIQNRLNAIRSKDVKTEGSLLDPEDAMLKIVEALKEWAVSGKIDCRFEA